MSLASAGRPTLAARASPRAIGDYSDRLLDQRLLVEGQERRIKRFRRRRHDNRRWRKSRFNAVIHREVGAPGGDADRGPDRQDGDLEQDVEGDRQRGHRRGAPLDADREKKKSAAEEEPEEEDPERPASIRRAWP